jgi:hypothetical protein
MTITADKIVRNWWDKLGDYQLMSDLNKTGSLNKLNGFLDACEQFGHLNPEETERIYRELTQ